MIRFAFCPAIAVLLSSVVPAGASAEQEMQANVTAQKLTFANPAGVGFREYGMTATTFGLSVPVGSRITMGAAFAHAGARMRSSVMDVRHSGLTDPEIFLSGRVGRLALRADVSLGVGSGTATWSQNVVAGLAAYDLMPFSIRSWGRGGGYALEARVPFRVRSSNVELLASTRDYRAYFPYSDDDFEYELGSEHRFGFRVARRVTALTGVEVGASLALAQPDRIGDGSEAFEPGRRVDAYAVVQLALPRTTALLSGTLSTRATGTASPALGAALGASTRDVVDRQLVVLSLRTRTVAPYPILASMSARFASTTAHSWFGTVGLGTELEIRGPWAGRVFVLPSMKVHRGHVAFVDAYESSLGGLEFSLGGRWSR